MVRSLGMMMHHVLHYRSHLNAMFNKSMCVSVCVYADPERTQDVPRGKFGLRLYLWASSTIITPIVIQASCKLRRPNINYHPGESE